MISAKTSIYGLIGNPLEHSISPQIQNAAFKQMELDAVYLCFHISGSVPRAVRSLSKLGIRGINATIPYKSEVMKALDRTDVLAEQVGAVNVVKFGDEIVGYNTDVTASIRSLKEGIGQDLAGLSVTLVGAGGSARAVAFGLAHAGCKIKISNRTASKASDLAGEITEKTRWERIDTTPYTKRGLKDAIARSDILINATPVGMHPNRNQAIADSTMLHSDLVVMDLVYNPPKTQLLYEAEKIGCITIGGLDMLVYQAVESIKIWTGEKAPTQVMLAEAKRALSSFTGSSPFQQT